MLQRTPKQDIEAPPIELSAAPLTNSSPTLPVIVTGRRKGFLILSKSALRSRALRKRQEEKADPLRSFGAVFIRGSSAQRLVLAMRPRPGAEYEKFTDGEFDAEIALAIAALVEKHFPPDAPRRKPKAK